VSDQNPSPPADDPVAEATEILNRAIADGHPLTPLEHAAARVQKAFASLVGLTESMEPCYRCGCCRRWTATLELLRAMVDRHQGILEQDDEGPTICGCDDCLVCAERSW
jgi:hypothetical protein